MAPVSTKGTAGNDLTTVPTTTHNSADDYGGPIYNPNGTLVTPAESNSGQYYANLEQQAAENAAADGNFVTNVLEPAAQTIGTVGLLGAVAVAPELAPFLGGGVAGAAAAGAIGGAASTTLSDNIRGTQVTAAGIGKGALMGGVTGGASAAAAPATSALTSAGLPSPIAAGLVKGGISAGTGALGSALNGGSPMTSALTGGVSGFISGAVGNATGSSVLGKVAGSVGTNALAPYLTSSNNGTTSTNNSGSNFLGAAALGAGAVGAGALLNGGQGNIGNMAATSVNSGLTQSALQGSYGAGSTDPSLASTITGALPGVIQSGIGSAGSLAAANAQVGADQSAITTQQTALGNINSIWGTQQQTGQGANTALQSSLGLNGQTADPSNFLNMPGYQFAVQQGTQAIQRQAAAMGNAYTPNTAAAVGQYVTGTAAQDYNTYISQLMGAAGLGTTANQGLQTGQQTTANNISTLQQNQGQATAAGYTGVANSTAGLFGVNGAGTGLINGALGGSGTTNGSGISTNGLTSAFAGTNLANNNQTTNAYNVANGPTSTDISNSTNGIGNINVGTIDTGDVPSVNLPNDSGDSDWSSFLGDNT